MTGKILERKIKMYKNRKTILSRQIMAGLVAGVLLGSIGYTCPTAA
jgi:hypothetical protein